MPKPRSVPRLMMVTDRRRSRHPVNVLCRQAALGGVDAIQIREKDLAYQELLAIAAHIIGHIPESAIVLVNDSVNVASNLGIGVHLPEGGLSPSAARRVLGSDALIGRSVHSADATIASAADYVIAGHVYPTASKPERPPIGLGGLSEIVAASPVPVIAIGGIDETNAQEIIEAGAHGLAVISAISRAQHPAEAAAELLAIIDRATGERMSNESATVNIIVNGKETPIDEGLAVANFLTHRGLQAKLVVVELNGVILPREEFDSTVLVSGDRVEVVHFVGGG